MTRFMLDTNAASGLVKGQPKVTARFKALRAGLERQGRSLGALDLMIAAHAAEHDMTLVTNDRAFSAVSGLRLEDWTQA
jgi:tRNA(fMet)-specific endonuclease VapC